MLDATYVLSPPEASTATVQSVGAKAATLACLTAAGIPVPAFFVVSSAAFALHLRQNRIPWPPAPDAVTSWEGWSAVREHIRTSPVESALSRQILDGYDRLGQDSGHGRVAVRSSGSEEDSPSVSFAGQFNSTLNVEGPRLLETVKDCWASYVSEASLQYRALHQIPVGPVPNFGVIVQVQVFSQRAGVVFTVHPLEPTRAVVYIEANFGSGESVVGGMVTPDTATYSRSHADVVDRITGTKRRMTAVSRDSPGSRVVEIEELQRREAVLTDFEVREISQTGLRIEELMGRPQDVEWAYDAERLWIVQARPITGLPASGF